MGKQNKASKKVMAKVAKPIVDKKLPTSKLRSTSNKLMKTHLRKTSVRPIPKQRLLDALDMLHNPDHEIWKERISCTKSIHRCDEVPATDFHVLLKFARQCLLRRDWNNLLQIVTVLVRKDKLGIFFPLITKYAGICLAHIDKKLFNNFAKLFVDIEGNDVLKACTILGHNRG